MRARSLVFAAAVVAGIAPAAAPADQTEVVRTTEPVVLTGAQFPSWSAGKDPTLREPGVPTNYDTYDIQGALPPPIRSECYRGPAFAPGQGTNPYDDDDNGDHNCYQSSRLPRGGREDLPIGVPIERLVGYRWDGSAFVQIPFQVDERFTRYITNNYSDFAFYSVVDAHNTYAFDREGFRYWWDAMLPDKAYSADKPTATECIPAAAPGSTVLPSTYHAGAYATTVDPVKGLDDDDELVFMWSDAGARAPAGEALPAGIEGAYEVAVGDPVNPANATFAYVMLAAENGPAPTDVEPYVRYERDPGVRAPDGTWLEPPADIFVFSQSNYEGYGAAPKGPYCELDGTPSATYRDERRNKPASPADPLGRAIEPRRPLDTAWIRTPRYWFRYDGRWLMTQLRISPDGTGLSDAPNLADDIVDQWKARAFQQRPGGRTPCCGYEEEVTNWGGSSMLMGERWGPVRVIRATWGADSSTNNIRIETFYRDEIRFGDALRVHVIPPLDGIYVQWDYNAGTVSTYYNPWKPGGVPVDGQNDEVFGNTFVHVAPDKVEVRDEDPVPVTGPIHVGVPLGGDYNGCQFEGPTDEIDGVCNDIDVTDPTHSGPIGNLNWEEIAGPNGSVVTRWTIKEHSGGDAFSLAATPYYRDDSCFDDGTGNDPGPHLRYARPDDDPARPEAYWGPNLDIPRECWTPESPDPSPSRRYWQGSIGTHGLHINFIADSDNAATTFPLTEMVSEQRMVVLPGEQDNVGDAYGRNTVEFPLSASARPFA